MLATAALAVIGSCQGSAQAGPRRDNLTASEIEQQRIRFKSRRATSVVITPASTSANGTDVEPIDVPADLTEQTPDPLEGVNRVFFKINEALDFVIVRPAAIVYRAVVPKPVRKGVANVLHNAATPIILANDILQGADGKRVEATVVRFMLNSTIGVGGLVDVGSKGGVEGHTEDFGQTLAVWGVGSGPYLVAPLIGPSNPRDLVGKVVDTAINPLTCLLIDEDFVVRSIPTVAEIVSEREAVLDEVDALRKSSPDFYVTVRQLYVEKRQAEIANGDVGFDPMPGTTSLPPIVPSFQITPSQKPF